MIPNDVIVVSPFIAAVLVALAVLVVDLVAPGKRAPVIVVSLVGLAIVAGLTLYVGSHDELIALANCGFCSGLGGSDTETIRATAFVSPKRMERSSAT